jgi:hypothetical protein
MHKIPTYDMTCDQTNQENTQKTIGSITSKGSQNTTGSTFLDVWEGFTGVDQV